MPKYEDYTDTELRNLRDNAQYSDNLTSSEQAALVEEIENELSARRSYRRRA